MDYHKIRSRLDEETGSPLVAQAILVHEGATYDQIQEYMETMGYDDFMEDEFTRDDVYNSIHSLQAKGIIALQDPVVGEEIDQEYDLTEKGEEFFEKDFDDLEDKKKTLQWLWGVAKKQK